MQAFIPSSSLTYDMILVNIKSAIFLRERNREILQIFDISLYTESALGLAKKLRRFVYVLYEVITINLILKQTWCQIFNTHHRRMILSKRLQRPEGNINDPTNYIYSVCLSIGLYAANKCTKI